MPSDPLNLEPKNGDFVDYIESLQASSQKNLDGITPPMTADHHIGLPPNAAGRADDGISLKDLIAAFRRKTGMPKASPQDSSREAALARMESSANPNAPEPVIAKPKKLDPAAKFAVSICWMLEASHQSSRTQITAGAAYSILPTYPPIKTKKGAFRGAFSLDYPAPNMDRTARWG